MKSPKFSSEKLLRSPEKIVFKNSGNPDKDF